MNTILFQLILGFTLFLIACAKNENPSIKQGDVKVTLLNNHKTVTITSPSGRYSVIYAVNYQNPEVVLAYLDHNEFGGSGRYKGYFQSFNAPPEVKVTHQTYTNTGYDRGHLISNDFFNFDKQLSEETFSVYNICPQLPDFNQGKNGYNAWKDLENAIEKSYANAYGRVYVITGPIFDKAVSQFNTLKNSQCVIPEKFYKVILVQDLKDESYEFTRLEAYIFEHRQPKSGETINLSDCKIIATDAVEENIGIVESTLNLKIALLNGAQESDSSTPSYDNNSSVLSSGIRPNISVGFMNIVFILSTILLYNLI